VADAALFVVSAATGIKFETETLWKAAGEQGLPRMMVVTKLDRERTSLAKVLEDAERFLGVKPVPIQVPIGRRGLLPRRRRPAPEQDRLFAADAGGKETLGEVPADLAEEVKLARERLVEGVAESDDALLEKYLDGQALTEEEIQGGLRAGVLAGKVVPLVFAVPVKNQGTAAIAELIFSLPAVPRGASGRSTGRTRPARRSSAPRRRTRRSRRSSSRRLVDPTPARSRSSASSRGASTATSSSTRRAARASGPARSTRCSARRSKAVPEVGPGLRRGREAQGDAHRRHPVRREAPRDFAPITFPHPVMSMAVDPRARATRTSSRRRCTGSPRPTR